MSQTTKIIAEEANIKSSVKIRIRQPHNRLKTGFKEGFAIGPLDRPTLPLNPRLDGSWDVVPVELEAVNSFVHTFRGYLSPCLFSPICVVGMARMSLAVLDSCIFLGCDTANTREKLSLGFALLKRAAEVWPLARRLAGDLKDVAAAYLPPRPADGAGSGSISSSGSNSGLSGLSGLNWPDDFFAVSMPEIDASLATATHPPFLATISSEGFEDWLSGGPPHAYERDG